MSNSLESPNSLRKVVEIFSIGLGIAGVGMGMLLSNWHPRIGVFLMILGAIYLLWEIFTSRPIAKVVPGMLRLVAGVMIAAFTLLMVGPDIEETLHPDHRNQVTVTWLDPAPITYGIPLSTNQLNAKASVDGQFAYYPGIGTILPVGTNILLATFTPAEPRKYSSPTANVHLAVNPVSTPPPSGPLPPKEKDGGGGSSAIFALQLKELMEVDEFLARKTESELRETFDFPNMLSYNIKMARRGLFPGSVTQQESAEIDTFFKDGQGRLDLRYFSVTEVNHRLEGHFEQNKIGIMNTSAKYIASRSMLGRYYSSPELPSNVVKALREFDGAVEKNTTLMLESLNDSLASDPRIILFNDTSGSSWWGSATGMYWKRFDQLKPYGDKVNAAIRSALATR